jgi:hypothetical protein
VANATTKQQGSTGASTMAGDAPGAYPLTFVEHAVVPHEPLVDDSCAARSSSQALLAEWLTYLTTDGQAHLTSGLVPLPPAMLEAAKAQVPKVGTAPATGKCGPAAPPDANPGGLPADVPSGDFPNGSDSGLPDNQFASEPGGGGSGSGGGSSSGGAGSGSGTGGPAGPATQAIAETGGGLPGFGGGASGVIGGTLALLALAVVGGVGGYVSSRRPSAGPDGEQPS